ncbi:alkaline phosphatase family protein [Methanotorris formicicus]|nr:2,3-bisphosphoglycerate-independent phosphoglycerate mutase [Methanotorris formicicus]
MRTILVLLDGLGDRPSKALNNKTPLEAANTPNLDEFAKRGATGLMIPYKEGIPLGSEVAHFLLWGYSLNDFPGRGFIESLGEDIEVKENEIYLRATFGFVEKCNGGLLVKDRRTKNVTKEEIDELIDSLPNYVNGYEFELKHSYDTHCILIIREENGWISDKISDSDPFYKNKHVMRVCPIKKLCKNKIEYDKAKSTADALNEYLKKCFKELDNHEINRKRSKMEKQKANMLLTKWAGKYKKVESFSERWGMGGVVIGNSSVFKGLARFLGMDYIKCEDFKEAIEMAVDLDYDFIHIHTKEIDEAGHTKKPEFKKEVIEKIDACLNPLLNLEDDLIVITADHSTPSVGNLIHSGESVPITIVGKYVRRDDVKEFNERACAKGSLYIRAYDLMNIILNYTDRALLYGLRPNRILKYIPDDSKTRHLRID